MERAEASSRGDEIEVWAENWDIVAAFASVLTQLRPISLGRGLLHYPGLDYTGARVSLGASHIRVTPELWAGIQIMERAACEAMNERQG